HLWEVDLQARGKPVAMSLLLLHPMPALFHQQQQSTSWFVILLQRTEAISVMHQQLQQQFSIGRVTLASGRVQGLTKLPGGLRMDRIDLDTFIFRKYPLAAAAE